MAEAIAYPLSVFQAGFVGGIFTESNNLLNPIQDIELPANGVWLNTAQIEDWVEITRMHLDKNTCNYLCNLGLKPGIVAEIVSKTASGSVIIRIDRQQIGLGAEITCKLVVKLVDRQNNES